MERRSLPNPKNVRIVPCHRWRCDHIQQYLLDTLSRQSISPENDDIVTTKKITQYTTISQLGSTFLCFFLGGIALFSRGSIDGSDSLESWKPILESARGDTRGLTRGSKSPTKTASEKLVDVPSCIQLWRLYTTDVLFISFKRDPPASHV